MVRAIPHTLRPRYSQRRAPAAAPALRSPPQAATHDSFSAASSSPSSHASACSSSSTHRSSSSTACCFKKDTTDLGEGEKGTWIGRGEEAGAHLSLGFGTVTSRPWSCRACGSFMPASHLELWWGGRRRSNWKWRGRDGESLGPSLSSVSPSMRPSPLLLRPFAAGASFAL